MKKKVLELFCGTKSFAKALDQTKYEFVSLDWDPQFEPTICEDIVTWNYSQFPKNEFDIIWASPECVTFSIATSGKYRSKAEPFGKEGPHKEAALAANAMVDALVKILQYFSPKVWYVENPRALLAHYPPFVDFIKEKNAFRTRIFYGNHGWPYPKPTHLWSNQRLWDDEDPPVIDPEKYLTRFARPGKKKHTRRDYAFYNKREYRGLIPETLTRKIAAAHDL